MLHREIRMQIGVIEAVRVTMLPIKLSSAPEHRKVGLMFGFWLCSRPNQLITWTDPVALGRSEANGAEESVHSNQDSSRVRFEDRGPGELDFGAGHLSPECSVCTEYSGRS